MRELALQDLPLQDLPIQDLALQAAGVVAIVVAIAHGAIAELRVFAKARIEPPRTRKLLRLIWQASTVDWIAVSHQQRPGHWKVARWMGVDELRCRPGAHGTLAGRSFNAGDGRHICKFDHGFPRS